jgi:hypothetical protein
MAGDCGSDGDTATDWFFLLFGSCALALRHGCASTWDQHHQRRQPNIRDEDKYPELYDGSHDSFIS